MGLFTVLGIMMFVGLISSVLSIMLAFMIPGMLWGAIPSPEAIAGVLEVILIYLAVILVIWLVVYILSILGCFRAAKEFKVGLFKAAGILYIIIVILALIMIPVAFIDIFMALGTMGIVLILGIISYIITAVSFFLIKPVAPGS